MTASELRLGNFVLYASEGKQFKVCELSHGGIEVNGEGEITWIEIEEFEGIPLTEEWLLKFGFQIKDIANYVTIDFTTYEKGKFLIGDNWEIEYDGDRLTLGYDIKYVHNLQNVFYALTGQELTLKGE